MALSIHHDEDLSDGSLKRRFGILATVMSLCFAILLGRLFWLQIVEGDTYRERAKTKFTTTETVPARRGIIRDRNGDALAHNVAVHQLTILPNSVSKAPVRTAVLGRLAELLEMTHDEVAAVDAAIVDKLQQDKAWERVVVDPRLVGDHCPYDGGELMLPDKPMPQADAEHQLFCHECGLRHEPVDADAVYCPHDKSRLEWTGEADHKHASCPKCRRSFVTTPICPTDGSLLKPSIRNLVCPICKRRFANEVAVVKGHMSDRVDEKTPMYPGLAVDIELMREYLRPSEFAHPLGYMAKVNAEEYRANKDIYGLEARVGRAGVEHALEPILRGTPGFAKYFKGADRSLPRSFQNATPGQDVFLTIDARLQRAVRDILRYQRSAAAVVMDPITGEILAMYSHPGYDPNRWSSGITRAEIEEEEKNPYDPLHNKAVTAYAPGSVFKIVTALATLREKVFGEDTPHATVHCPGYYDYGGRRFGCHFKSGHGPTDLVGALKGSCDVYFYQAAERMGMDTLARYAREFGFGEVTGVEISESKGLIPTVDWLNQHTSLGFQPGLTLSAGIGQGQVTASPLQVTRSFAVIANGGRLVVPHIVSQYADENGQPTQKFLPVDERNVVMTEGQLALIRQGLWDVVNDPHGTAHKLYDPDFIFAGKTGTAEAEQTRPGADPELATWLAEDHAWFTLYAPVPPQEPQVVVTVFVEHGGSGSQDAAPLAKAILQAWKRLGLYRAPPAVDGDEVIDPDVVPDGPSAPDEPAPDRRTP